MSGLRQEIRFTRAADRTRIAFASMGSTGYPLVKTPHWLTHLERDGQSPLFRPWYDALAARFRFYRYDGRGCGLSDRDPPDLSLDAMVADLEAVVDAARLDRFALLGSCQGGAVSITYAARHPERVSHLVLFGAYARGPLRRNPSLKQAEAIQAQLKLIDHGWGREQDAFRQIFTSQLFPKASAAEQHAFNEIQRTVCAPNEAARLAGAFFELDASPCLARVSCPTLVLHARGDQFVPFDAEALFIAASIADARLQTLDTDAHVPLAEDPAFAQALTALDSFLPRRRIEVAPPEIATLTRRERQILALVARGLDNSEIAVQLVLAEKTVRNNITSIFDKISVKSRAQAMLSAMRAGLVGTPGAIDSDHPDRSPLFYASQPATGNRDRSPEVSGTIGVVPSATGTMAS